MENHTYTRNVSQLPTMALRKLYLAHVDANRARHNWYSRKCKKHAVDPSELLVLKANCKKASLELRQALAAHRTKLKICWGNSGQIMSFLTRTEVRAQAIMRRKALQYQRERDALFRFKRAINGWVFANITSRSALS
jgi:hypothetical protein